MFEKYWLCELKFVKVKGKKENYEYICIKKQECENVYVLALGKAFAPHEVEFVKNVEASDMLGVTGLSERVRFDIDGEGAAYAYYWGQLNVFDARRIERHHNKVIKKKEDNNLIKRR